MSDFPQQNITRLGHRIRPSDTVPLRPASMTQVELAALEERCLRCRDFRIARCLGLRAARVTFLRHAGHPSYKEYEMEWFERGHIRLARIQAAEARREADRDRRLRECLRMALEARRQDDAAEAALFAVETSKPCAAETSEEYPPLSPAERSGKRLLDFFSETRRLGWVLLGIAAYFVFGTLYPGGWTGAWMDWTGVIR